MNIIQQAVAELDAKIGQLTTARESLKQCEAILYPGRVVTVPAQTKAPAPGRRGRPPAVRVGKLDLAGGDARATNGAVNYGGDRNPLTPIVAKLAEPFAPADLMKAAKVENKTATNYCGNREAKGELVRVGRGQYKRGPKFPKPNAGESLLASIHEEIDAAKPKD